MTESTIAERLARVEEKLDALAPRGWVSELVQPIRDAVLKTQHSVESLSEDIKMLFTAHDSLLKDRAEFERRLFEEKLKQLEDDRESAKQNQLSTVIKERWVPFLSFIVAGAAILTLAGQVLTFWITHYVLPLAK